MAGIDNIRSGQLFNTNNRPSARADSSASHSTASRDVKTTAGQDSVSLSSQGKAMGQLQQSMAATPAFDAAKVAAIKEAIANGSYQVDPERLADNIMKFENELAPQNKA
ncbi:flagellar biosynthesis anti-sigma factor FlgM [Vibrio sp. SM6]|uniref:Negative regulator of flagellin synthesis n=1 Tax=Vibrio agarilyticus TaxID=2726741 RepID=A0A7X8YF94_9VIBR|nr:flagellar biosynthesis anti-sigma factor FlgM [Vibrio agarilyticus]NLS11633.1 flagellar biosynthesis anti-sigma factor FlgM [Vibrio agarilyticus]